MAVKRKPKSKLEDKEQSRRFVETARKLGVDENSKPFQRALSAVIPQKKSKR